MLINFTNHPYEIWNAPQREAAKEAFGEVVDLPFPQIPPSMEAADIRELVEQYAKKIDSMQGDAVLLAGEFTFTFMMVDKLLTEGKKVFCSCSKRLTTEEKKPDGSNEKHSIFLFERFRAYEHYRKE